MLARGASCAAHLQPLPPALAPDLAASALSLSFSACCVPASAWLGAAGGDLDTATSLFFSMQDGGGGAVAEPGAADALGFEPPDWYGLVWPAVEALPEAWLEQGLSFSEASQELIQPKNGPCGVLAAVHGVVVARELAAGRAVEPKTPVTDGT